MKKLIMFISMVLLLSTGSFYSVSKVEAAEKISATTTANLNVREKPSTTGKKLGILKAGTKVEVHEKLKSSWSKITYNKKTAYINTKYLNFNNTASSSWNGKYAFSLKESDYSEGGTLIISNEGSGKFYFELEVWNYFKERDSGFNGNVEGYATVKGNTAKINIDDDGLTCEMTMTKSSTGIEVQENHSNEYGGGCYDFRGVNISYDGVYKKK